MTQALPDIFLALSKLIPDRVEWTFGPDVHDGFGQVMWRGMPHYVYWKGGEEHGWESDQIGEALFEYGLREECEARGWYYSQHCIPVDGQGDGQWYRAEIGPHGEGEAATPAHAFSAALLSALEAAQAAAVAADRQAHPESKFDVVGAE